MKRSKKKKKKETVNKESRLDKMTRDKILARLKRHYERCRRKKEKTRILDEYCDVTGDRRKHAMVQMHGGRGRRGNAGERKRGRPARYTHALVAPLHVIWRAVGYCCAELLHAALGDVMERLICHERLDVTDECRRLLTQMSCSTLKRMLTHLPGKAVRRRRPRRERALHARIPLSVLQPKPSAAGTFECDLVEHNGGASGGEYIYTVHAVDVVTGWRVNRACVGKHRLRVLHALQYVIQQVPYAVQVLDTDHDRAFINERTVAQLARRGVRMTRSRAYKKNDNAHVEQKNGTDVRGLVGYRRYDTDEQCRL